MFSITNNDKKVWEEYVANFNNYTINSHFPDNKRLTQTKNSLSVKKKETKNFSKLLKKGKIKLDDIIDLHGYKLGNAKIAFVNFINKSYLSNNKIILVVTGKGYNNMGVLRKELPKWLSEKEISKYIISFNFAPKKFGGTGAFLIRIRTKGKI